MKSQRTQTHAISGLLMLQSAALLAIVLITLPLIFKRHEMDVGLYFRYSGNLLGGQIPYRDFKMEYPPLALVSFVLPRLAVFGQNIAFDTYIRLFLLENILLTALTALALTWIADAWQPERDATQVVALFTLFAAILGPLLPWRYDLFPAFLTVLALLALLRDRPAWAGVWLGLGAAAKLYPLVLLPIVGVYYLAQGDWRATIRVTAGCIGATIVALLPVFILAPANLMSFVQYHELRGLQVETLPAGVIMLGHIFGHLAARIEFSYGSVNLTSPLSQMVLAWLPGALIVTFALVLGLAAARFYDEHRKNGFVSHETLIAFLMAALLSFIATNKVFSPQYILWLLPFAPLLRLRYTIVLLAICALTIGLFPFDYDDLLAMHILEVSALNLRNILIVVLLVWLALSYAPAWLWQPFARLQNATRNLQGSEI